MPQAHDLKGKRIGHLTVLFRVRSSKRRGTQWRCECVCGNRLTIPTFYLTRPNPKQHCGCAPGELRPSVKHRDTYLSWLAMFARCTKEDHVSYKNYGGRGITICERWHDFENFLEDMGERPSKKFSLDRIDPDGNYEPGNARWATATQQANNKRIHKRGKQS